MLPSHTLLLQVLLYLSRHPGIPTSMTRGICSSACKMSVRLYLAIARVCQAAGTCSARDHMERTAVCPRSSTAYPNDELRISPMIFKNIWIIPMMNYANIASTGHTAPKQTISLCSPHDRTPGSHPTRNTPHDAPCLSAPVGNLPTGDYP